MFTPELTYSTQNHKKQRASKVFYQQVKNVSNVDSSNVIKSSDLELPWVALIQLVTTLKENSNHLPLSSRTHQEWTISLLNDS